MNNIGRALVERRSSDSPTKTLHVARADVGANYFRTLRIPILQGREFWEGDRKGAPRVAIISRRIAEQLWPGSNPVGEIIGLGGGDPTRLPQWSRVIGVVGEVAPAVMDAAPRGTVYLPASQSGFIPRTLVVRHRGDAATILRLVTRTALAVDPDVEILRAATVEDVVARMRYPRRAATALLAASGGVGIVLAVVGLLGMLAHSVNQRMREMGVRAALGAGQKALSGLVLREGLGIGATGVALGVVLAFAGARVASRFLVPISDPDPGTVLATLLLVLALVAAASYVPARHASNVDPASVLRQQ